MMGDMGTSAGAGDPPARQGPAPYLPEPTGPSPVGTTTLHLTDASRPDPWAAEPAARELMISVWYPATPSDGPRAPYMTAAESELLLANAGVTVVPSGTLSRVQTNAISGAPPAGARPPGLPLVVLSPGFIHPRSALTALAEDLASHGYVAAGIDHTYESVATEFPDGRVTTALARDDRRRDRSEKAVAGRAADVSFLLGELTGAHPLWPGAGLIDATRIGMAGHSIGGAAAIAAMLADPRIRAGIDMDGATSAPIPSGGLSRPFLFLGKQSNYTPGGVITSERQRKMAGSVATWERDWKLMTGWKRWLVVAGAVHASFTDLALLADQIGVDTEAGIPGTRSLEITRAYVRAFFDQHLRGDPQTLLDQPSPDYPEVTFCSPQTAGPRHRRG
jgi:dienelactone hydrolase